MSATRKLFPNSKGRLEFLLLDLADLTTVKNAAETFMSKEDRLDVLVNNAGVMRPPAGSKTAQGYEQQLGTNALGHFLLAELLVPILKNTAASSPADTVRVTWAGSLGIRVHSPPNGVSFDSNGTPELFESQDLNYGQSKAANQLMSVEFARRYAADGIVSICFNPGSLKSELQRHDTGLRLFLADMIFLHPVVFGAYTELYAGWSADITQNGSCQYVIPWGRDGTSSLRKDLVDAIASKKEGGSIAQKYWEWSESETSKYR